MPINTEKIRQELDVMEALAKKKKLSFEVIYNAYDYDVISCIDAAQARNVRPSQELKHLVIETEHCFLLAHIPGDRRISLRKVKNMIRGKRASLASLGKFKPFGPGTVCPFLNPFWKFIHLIDVDVLSKKTMTTNNGTTRGFIRFSPQLLLLGVSIVADLKEYGQGRLPWMS